MNGGYQTIQRNVWNVVFPAGAIAVLMLCFTFIGDGLRDALDPAHARVAASFETERRGKSRLRGERRRASWLRRSPSLDA